MFKLSPDCTARAATQTNGLGQEHALTIIIGKSHIVIVRTLARMKGSCRFARPACAREGLDKQTTSQHRIHNEDNEPCAVSLRRVLESSTVVAHMDSSRTNIQ
jgi:hypothetical protein